MKTILKTEEALKLIVSYWFSLQLGFAWWTFLAWLIAPDISIAAYAVNSRVGAMVYNAFHHQGLAIVVGLTGVYLQNKELEFAGLLLFGHSSMDRVFGYGLKYPDDFKHTHLGWIGQRH
jgi:hypothetical protein